jgi:hypothetical protein
LWKFDVTTIADYAIMLRKSSATAWATTGLGADAPLGNGTYLFYDKGTSSYNQWILVPVDMLEINKAKLTTRLNEAYYLADANSLSVAYDRFYESLDEFHDYIDGDLNEAEVAAAVNTIDSLITNYTLILDIEQRLEVANAIVAEHGDPGAEDYELTLAGYAEAIEEPISNEALTALSAEFADAVIAYGIPHASDDFPVDVTKWVVNPDFSDPTANKGWTTYRTVGNAWGQKTFNTGVWTMPQMEVWRISTSAPDPNRYAQQTVSNLPIGKYRVKAAVWAADQSPDPNETVGSVVLFAGDGTSPITIYDYERDTPANEAGVAAAGAYYSVEGYSVDGSLTLGLRDNGSNANWLGIDNVSLEYLGMNEDDVTAIRTALIDKANGLLGEDFLSIQKDYLSDATAAFEDTDLSDINQATQAFATLSAVIDSCQHAITDMAAFRTNSLATLVAIAENAEGQYPEPLVDLIVDLVLTWEEDLAADDFTVAQYEALKVSATDYKTYTDKYIAAYDYSFGTPNAANAELIISILTAEHSIVTANPEHLPSAINILSSLVSYATAYDAVTSVLEEGAFDAESLAAANEQVSSNVAAVTADPTTIPAKTTELWKIVRALQLTDATIDNGDGTKNVTTWIVNPSFEADPTDRATVFPGWTKTGPTSTEFCVRTDDGSNLELDSLTIGGEKFPYIDGETYVQYWAASTLRDFSVEQTIIVPNGEYTLTAAMYLGGNGWFLFANNDETQAVAGVTNNYSVTVSVQDNTLHLGVKAVAAESNWAQADNFRLQLNELYADGIKTVGEQGTLVGVSVEDGYIKVAGAETFTITSPTGIQYPPTAKLPAGIYIIRAGSKTLKVAVP